MASYRLGHSVLDFDTESSSVVKGESVFYTLKTVEAMKPDLFVVRKNYDKRSGEMTLSEMAYKLNVPVISAGEGALSHPTQALLDLMTIRENLKDPSEVKVLLVGDIRHSRVAKSDFVLFTKMGFQCGVCAPFEWQPSNWMGEYKKFENLRDGLDWADVAMALRIQKERQSQIAGGESWAKENQFSKKAFRDWKSDGLIMHPGPFNLGVEIQEEVLEDSRCKIFEQKENGVYVRAALIQSILEERP